MLEPRCTFRRCTKNLEPYTFNNLFTFDNEGETVVRPLQDTLRLNQKPTIPVSGTAGWLFHFRLTVVFFR